MDWNSGVSDNKETMIKENKDYTFSSQHLWEERNILSRGQRMANLSSRQESEQ
jgi:hypothetical protein